MPGTLTQADLLAMIGSSLTVRSDTFKIRVYGSARNPMTGAAEGEVWLEATVQRVPEYYISKLTNASDGDYADARPGFKRDGGIQNDINELYGRRFQVVSVTWLTEDEI